MSARRNDEVTDAVEGSLRQLDHFYESWATHDPAAVAACFDEHGVFEDLTLGTRHVGHEALRSFATEVFAVLRRVDMVRVDGFGAVDAVAAHWRLHAEKADASPSGGVVSLVIEGLDVCRLAGGRLMHVRHSWDLRQWK